MVFCKRYLMVIGCVASQVMFAQDIDRTVYSTSGKSASNSNLHLSYNIGETIVFTGTATNLIVSQGFEQPDPVIVTYVDNLDKSLNVNAFPNPVKNALYLNLSPLLAAPDLTIEVADVLGKKAAACWEQRSSLSDQPIAIDFSSCSSGIYFLKVTSQQTRFHKTLKIIKE